MSYTFQPENSASAHATGATAAGSMEQARAQILNLKPASRFYYIHHADSWHLVETKAGFEWMPQLKCFRLTPGVNGVRQTRGKNPQPDDRAARVRLADRGFNIIPYDAIEGGYCWKYQGRRGPVFLERWAIPKQVGNRTILKSDQEGLWAFCRHLIKNNLVAFPDRDVLEIMGETHLQSIERDSGNVHIPAVAARHAENLRRLDGMKAATDKMFAPPKPAKKAKATKAKSE